MNGEELLRLRAEARAALSADRAEIDAAMSILANTGDAAALRRMTPFTEQALTYQRRG